MKQVRQLLASKGHDVWSITPDASVYSALEFMAEKDIGALPVLEGERLAGIFSERDYARKVILMGRASKETPVRDVMTKKVYVVQPSYTVEACMALMTEKRIRHLPVVEEDKLIGIISIGDVVKDIIAEQEFVIEQLENYISGTR